MTATDLSTARDERSARSVAAEERMPGTGWPWNRVRWVACVMYVAGLALFVWLAGIPTDRLGIYAGILVFLSIMVLGRGWAAWWRMMRDWLPFEAVLIAYDYSRGYASPYDDYELNFHIFPIHGVSNDLGLPLHVMFPIRFDQWFGRLFGGDGVMPTTWVQEHFHPGSGVPWYGILISITYSTHFLVMPTVAVVLWMRNQERFRVWMRMVVVLAVAGVATYFVYPMAPPWLADDGGVFPGPHVGRFTTEGFDAVGLKMVGGIVSQGQYLVNPVAAMPSLHMAYATLVVGFFWWGKRWWQRTLLVLYPLAMGFSLVYGGEHYVVDELFGVLYALAVIAGWRLLRRRRIAAAPA